MRPAAEIAGTYLCKVEATDEQLGVLKSVDGCYVNHVEATQEQEDTLLKIASAFFGAEEYGVESDPAWDGIWKDCEIKTPYEFNAVDRLHFVGKMGFLM